MKCKKCNNEFTTKERLKLHKKKAHPDKARVHKGTYWTDDVGGGI